MLARALRQIYFMNCVSCLIQTGGNVSQKISRGALKFAIYAMPWTYILSIDEIPDKAVMAAVELLSKYGTKQQSWNTINRDNAFLCIKTPTRLFAQIIQKYKGFETEDE
eukprot:192545_1